MTKKNDKLNVSFILDETGSMYPFKAETITGFNKYLKELKTERKGKPTAFTLTLFNTQKTEVRCDAAPLRKVKKLADDTYNPFAWTDLYDAIGRTIRTLESSIGKKGKAIVIIFTDGEENSSKEWTMNSVRKLIEEKQSEGWAFVYLGANQNAWHAGAHIGVNQSNITTYDQTKTAAAMNVALGATRAYTQTGGLQVDNLISEEDNE